jgi:hypothetical protein
MSHGPITFDPSAWTGMGQWPSPKEYPLPCPVQARQSSRKRLITASVIMLVGAPFLIFSLQGYLARAI